MPSDLHILAVDDDAKLRNLLARFLEKEGAIVTTAKDAQHTRELLAQDQTYSAIILDVMMPGEDGITLTAFIKTQYPDIPVLLLTAKGESQDRIAGLENGADDYLMKPFEPKELWLRLQNLVRIYTKTPPTHSHTENIDDSLSFGQYRFSLTSHKLSDRNTNQPVYLTSSETELLHMLALNANEPVARETFSQELHGISERSIDVHINRLRQKLEHDPKKPAFIKTVRNKGYMLQV